MNSDTTKNGNSSICGCRADARSDSPETVHIFSTATEALQNAAPVGATVHAIGFDSVDFILRAGYRLVERDADVTIARGGEREFTAAREASKFSKLILCPTHAYAAAATCKYRAFDGAFAVTETGSMPFAAVFDRHDVDRNLASIFGELIALDLAAFDLTFAAHMQGLEIDTAANEEVAAILTETTAKLKGREKDIEHCKDVLAGAGQRAAQAVSRRPELLHCSGAAQMTEAVRMLYAAEDRQLGMRGETEAVLAAFMTDFYLKNLDGGDRPLFPPDNNRRIDSVCEYFGADLRRACVYAAPIYPPIKMRLVEYRRDEFRAETARQLSEVKHRQASAAQVFKRLYPDDGYGIKNLVDRSDLGICLALAPDVFAADSMLSFLKQTGKLDEYMI